MQTATGPDDEDACPDTSSFVLGSLGQTVNLQDGCAPYQLDSDLDGLDDGSDLCSNTQAGLAIDEFGCHPSQKDSDGDSVTDDLDLCPGTLQNREPPGMLSRRIDEGGTGVDDGSGAGEDESDGSGAGEDGHGSGAEDGPGDEDLAGESGKGFSITCSLL